jgi:hypothetical protein
MIRDLEDKDMQEIFSIHNEQGFEYALPEFSSPLVLVKKVRVENGRVVGAMFLRLTAEAFLLVEGSPIQKARSIEELQPEVDREAFVKGLDEYVCVVPPEIAETFAPVLEKRGFEKLREWPLWQRSLNA